MKKTILAARRQLAIEKISEKSGIDLAPSNFPARAPNAEVRQLFELEYIAQELPEGGSQEDSSLAEVLAIIEQTKGVGPSLFEKIKRELEENGFAN